MTTGFDAGCVVGAIVVPAAAAAAVVARRPTDPPPAIESVVVYSNWHPAKQPLTGSSADTKKNINKIITTSSPYGSAAFVDPPALSNAFIFLSFFFFSKESQNK